MKGVAIWCNHSDKRKWISCILARKMKKEKKTVGWPAEQMHAKSRRSISRARCWTNTQDHRQMTSRNQRLQCGVCTCTVIREPRSKNIEECISEYWWCRAEKEQHCHYPSPAKWHTLRLAFFDTRNIALAVTHKSPASPVTQQQEKCQSCAQVINSYW